MILKKTNHYGVNSIFFVFLDSQIHFLKMDIKSMSKIEKSIQELKNVYD